MSRFDEVNFERKFSNETRRRRMLELLVSSLSTLDRMQNPSWPESRRHALQYKDGMLRLHLGHKIVMSLRPDSVFIALDPDAELLGLSSLNHHEIPSIERTESNDLLAYARPASINPLYRTELFDSEDWMHLVPAHASYLRAILRAGHKNAEVTRNDPQLESYVRNVTGSSRSAVPPPPSEAAALEGEPRLVSHFQRERDSSLVKEKLRQVLQLASEIRCEACGFVAADIYGDLDSHLCDVHHLLPLNELPGQRETKLSDLAVLCPTCHRAIHRTSPMMSVEDFRAKYHSMERHSYANGRH